MKRTMVSIEVGSSIDEVSGGRNLRRGLFDWLVSGEQTEEGQVGFDGLSALPAPMARPEPIKDAIEKLNKAFSKSAL